MISKIAMDVAASMNTIMNSPEHRNVFAKPTVSFVKKASMDESNADSDKDDELKDLLEELKACVSDADRKKCKKICDMICDMCGEEEDEDEKEDEEDKSDAQDPYSGMGLPDSMNALVTNLVSMGEALDRFGLEKSATAATQTLQILISEAKKAVDPKDAKAKAKAEADAKKAKADKAKADDRAKKEKEKAKAKVEAEKAAAKAKKEKMSKKANDRADNALERVELNFADDFMPEDDMMSDDDLMSDDNAEGEELDFWQRNLGKDYVDGVRAEQAKRDAKRDGTGGMSWEDYIKDVSAEKEGKEAERAAAIAEAEKTDVFGNQVYVKYKRDKNKAEDSEDEDDCGDMAYAKDKDVEEDDDDCGDVKEVAKEAAAYAARLFLRRG